MPLAQIENCVKRRELSEAETALRQNISQKGQGTKVSFFSISVKLMEQLLDVGVTNIIVFFLNVIFVAPEVRMLTTSRTTDILRSLRMLRSSVAQGWSLVVLLRRSRSWLIAYESGG